MKSRRQFALPGLSRQRKRPAARLDPRLDALFADRQLWLDVGGQLAWKQEQMKRRTARNARLRVRRLEGYAE